MNAPFVDAVTKAINSNSDCWEIHYYAGPDFDWCQRRGRTYTHTRNQALGPEWREWRLCVMRVRGELPWVMV